MTNPITLAMLIEEQLGASVWALGRILDRCRSLTPEQFQRGLAIGPGSLAETLWHMIDAMFYFADGFAGRPYVDVALESRHDTPEALRALLDRAEDELRRSICTRLDRSPCAPVRFPSADAEIPLITAIAQIFDHASYHRAQCIHQLKRLGALEPSLELSPLDRAVGAG